MRATLPLLDASELRDGEARTVQVNGRAFAVFKIEGQFYATDDECPHVGASLGSGWVEGGQIVCSFHGWTFDIKSGNCLNCADRPLRTYPTRVADGKVYVEVSS